MKKIKNLLSFIVMLLYFIVSKIKEILFIIILFCIVPNINASTIYGSISVRTPKEENPIDYELQAGLRGMLYLDSAYGLYERENGEYYRGVYFKSDESESNQVLLNGWSGKLHISEANEINEQVIYKNFFNLAKIFKLRSSAMWDRWKWQGVFVGATIDFSTKNIITEMSYDTNLMGDFVFTSKFEHEILLNDFMLVPLLKYELRPDNEFIQGKIEVRFRLNKEEIRLNKEESNGNTK